MDCVICLDEDEAFNMTTVCNHSFHQSCLDQWLLHNNHVHIVEQLFKKMMMMMMKI